MRCVQTEQSGFNRFFFFHHHFPFFPFLSDCATPEGIADAAERTVATDAVFFCFLRFPFDPPPFFFSGASDVRTGSKATHRPRGTLQKQTKKPSLRRDSTTEQVNSAGGLDPRIALHPPPLRAKRGCKERKKKKQNKYLAGHRRRERIRRRLPINLLCFAASRTNRVRRHLRRV